MVNNFNFKTLYEKYFLSAIISFLFVFAAKANNVTVNNLTNCDVKIHAEGSILPGILINTFPPGTSTMAATGHVDVAKIYVDGIEPSFPMGLGASILFFNSVVAGHPNPPCITTAGFMATWIQANPTDHITITIFPI